MRHILAALLLALGLAMSTHASAKDRPPPPGVGALTEATTPQDALAAAVALVRDGYKPRDAPLVEAALREAAGLLDAQGRAGKDPETHALAGDLYALHLDAFPDSDHAHDVAFALGEVNYKLRRYDDAWAAFGRAVDADPDGPHAAFCAESAAFAAEEMVQREVGYPPYGKHTDPIPLTTWEQRVIDAWARVLTAYPDAPLGQDAAHRIGYAYYNHNLFDDAEPWFRRQIAATPDTPQACNAANLILDGYLRREAWSDGHAAALALIADPALSTPACHDELAEMVSLLAFKMAEAP